MVLYDILVGYIESKKYTNLVCVDDVVSIYIHGQRCNSGYFTYCMESITNQDMIEFYIPLNRRVIVETVSISNDNGVVSRYKKSFTFSGEEFRRVMAIYVRNCLLDKII